MYINQNNGIVLIIQSILNIIKMGQNKSVARSNGFNDLKILHSSRLVLSKQRAEYLHTLKNAKTEEERSKLKRKLEEQRDVIASINRSISSCQSEEDASNHRYIRINILK